MGRRVVSHRLMVPPPAPWRIQFDPAIGFYLTTPNGILPPKRNIPIIEPGGDEVGVGRPAKAAANVGHVVCEIWQGSDAATLVRDGVFNSVEHHLDHVPESGEYMTPDEIRSLWAMKGHDPAPWEIKAIELSRAIPMIVGVAPARLKLAAAIGPVTRFSLMSGLIDESDNPDDFAEKQFITGNNHWARQTLKECFELLNKSSPALGGGSMIDL